MPTFKNIRIKKRGGGSRLQRVQVLASGKYKFVKNKPGSKSTVRKVTKSKSRKKSNPKRSVNRTAKKNKKYSLFYIGALGYTFRGEINTLATMDLRQKETWLHLGRGVIEAITGFNIKHGSFTPEIPIKAILSFVLAGFAKKHVGKYVNRGLRMIPLLGEYITA